MTTLQKIRYVLLTSSVWLLLMQRCAGSPVSVLSPIADRADFIPFDKWHCGAGDFDKQLSHQLTESECPARMYEANLCCLAHDLCYVEEAQEHCDSAFCFCLNRTLSMPNSNHSLGCTNVAEGFCDIVKIFGGAAHSSAKKIQTASINTTPTPSSTATSSPANIVQFVTHNISLHCFSQELGNCLEGLHKCMLGYSQQLTTDANNQLSSDSVWSVCSQHFCECATAKPLILNKLGYQHQNNNQCEDSLQMACKRMPFKPVDSVNVNIQLWTTNGNYLGAGTIFAITLLLLALVSVLTLVVLICLCYKCYKSYKARRSEGCGISGADEFVSRARRHTLKKEDQQEPGYKCFHDKISIERPIERLHTFDHLLPMNSSKAQLIAEDSNSVSNSTSTPSINSAA